MFVHIYDNDPAWLKHFHYDVFQPYNVGKSGKPDTTEKSQLRFQFFMNGSGDINSLSLKLEPTIDHLSFKKTPRTVKTSADELQKFVGEYELGSAVVKISVKNNTLFALIPGQPEYELSAIENNRFAIKILNGYFVAFDVNGTDVSQLTFQQPNGNFVAKRKK